MKHADLMQHHIHDAEFSDENTENNLNRQNGHFKIHSAGKSSQNVTGIKKIIQNDITWVI